MSQIYHVLYQVPGRSTVPYLVALPVIEYLLYQYNYIAVPSDSSTKISFFYYYGLLVPRLVLPERRKGDPRRVRSGKCRRQAHR